MPGLAAFAGPVRRVGLLDAPAFFGTYSRLLIDLNRPLTAPDSIPNISEGTVVPANVHLDAEDSSAKSKELARRLGL